MHDLRYRSGVARRQGRAFRGLATLFAVCSAVAIGGGSVAHAADTSKSSSSVLATLKVKASGVEVKTKGASSYITAKEGQALKQGDALRTDATGRAEISYTDGSLTRLGVSTEFSITKLTDKKGARQTQGSLTVGSTWNRAAEVSQSGEFSIKAGGATAAVAGHGVRGHLRDGRRGVHRHRDRRRHLGRRAMSGTSPP